MERPHSLTGDIRTHAFSSTHVSSPRTVLVYLPPGYEASDQRFPVLYLHDGQNVFDSATAHGGNEWRVDETAQQLITAGLIEPLIIVAVYNAGESRPDDYTPTATDKGGGHADAYGRMLVEELKPFIDTTYRTLRDAPNTGMGGSSLGGLVTLHLGLRHPKTFGKLAALSPSVWWDDRVILRDVDGLPRKTPQRIWLDAGTREGADVIPDARRLRDVLVRKGWSIAEDPSLGRDMELLVFGHGGARAVVFPSSMGKFFEWEDRGMIDALGEHLDRGWLQLYCVDSVDSDSWYAKSKPPAARATTHAAYDAYVRDEVLPLTWQKNKTPFLMTMGASFGAYHAVTFALRYPHVVARAIGLSGLYDIREQTDGYSDQTVYHYNPADFILGEQDPSGSARSARWT